MKTIVKMLILVSLLTLSGCVVVPPRQQGYSSYLEGNGGGYSSGVYITPPPVYITPSYGYSPYRRGYNYNYRWNNRPRGGYGYRHHHHHHYR